MFTQSRHFFSFYLFIFLSFFVVQTGLEFSDLPASGLKVCDTTWQSLRFLLVFFQTWFGIVVSGGGQLYTTLQPLRSALRSYPSLCFPLGVSPHGALSTFMSSTTYTSLNLGST